MDGFEQYLRNLPRTSSQLYRRHPYIVSEETDGKTLHVAVPSRNLVIKFEFDSDPFPADYANRPHASLEKIAKDLRVEELKRIALKGFALLPPVMDVDIPLNPWLP